MKKVWYTLLGCWIRRARHSGLWQVKSGHPGKGNCQLSQDNFAPDLTNYILEGKRIRAMLTLFIVRVVVVTVVIMIMVMIAIMMMMMMMMQCSKRRFWLPW